MNEFSNCEFEQQDYGTEGLNSGVSAVFNGILIWYLGKRRKKMESSLLVSSGHATTEYKSYQHEHDNDCDMICLWRKLLLAHQAHLVLSVQYSAL